jgi:hypothetical protein
MVLAMRNYTASWFTLGIVLGIATLTVAAFAGWW